LHQLTSILLDIGQIRQWISFEAVITFLLFISVVVLLNPDQPLVDLFLHVSSGLSESLSLLLHVSAGLSEILSTTRTGLLLSVSLKKRELLSHKLIISLLLPEELNV